MKEFFERIFRQPCSAKIAPEENLATEITAFLLNEFKPLRDRLFGRLDIFDDNSSWIVTTQSKLYAPAMPWNGRIPDLMIHSPLRRLTIIIEVKIDAGPTDEQLSMYEQYLQDATSRGEISDWRLATLTRWTPDSSLRTDSGSAIEIRFTDIENWILSSCTAEDNNFVSELAVLWARYLLARRWAMPQITSRHIEALAAIHELLPLISDLVNAATDSALIDNDKEWKITGKSSSGSWGEGEIIWARTLVSDKIPGRVQIGCFYGMENNQPCLRPLVQLWDSYSPPAQLEQGWEVRDRYGGVQIALENIVPKVLESPARVWDEMKASIGRAIAQLTIKAN